MTDSQPPNRHADHHEQTGESNVQQNVGQAYNSTLKGRETNLHLSGLPVMIVALALVVLIGVIFVITYSRQPETVGPAALQSPTPIPPGAQAESYLFYVDVSANMNKVIGGKQAYEWAQDVIAGIWNGIRIDPAQTRSALIKVGGGTDNACNQIEHVNFGRGSSIPVSDYLSPLNRTQPSGDSAYAEGFVNAMDYFQAPDASSTERKYLIALMGDYRGTPGCERQDRLDLPDLLERYSNNGIEVELCAFSFLSDDTQFTVWLRDQIQDYTVDCVLNIHNEADVRAASSRTISIINNNRVLYENTATPAPPTVTPTLTPHPSSTPTATSTLTTTPEPTSTVFACPGALPPRLQVGGNGRVLPVLANTVRANPSLSGPRVAQLLAGSIFSVLDGPLCADGYTWYHVQPADGSVGGWTAEGGGEEYWLEPVEISALTIYRQENALTLYLPTTSRIDFSSFTIATTRLELWIADDFGLLPESAPLDGGDGLCLIYIRERSIPPLLRDCIQNTVEHPLHPADVFWQDSLGRHQVDLIIRYKGRSFICRADEEVCEFLLDATTAGGDTDH